MRGYWGSRKSEEIGGLSIIGNGDHYTEVNVTRETVFAIFGVLLVIFGIAAEIIQTIRYKDTVIVIGKPQRIIRILLVIVGIVLIALSLIPIRFDPPPPTPEPTPSPVVVVDTATQWNWTLNTNSTKSTGTANAISVVEDALMLSYEVGEDGYVVLTSNIPAGVLAEAEGISFRYKGTGADNSIEFKLMLRFNGDTGDTTYGKLIQHSSNTKGEWVQVELAFEDLTCWWPEENCNIYGDLLNPNMVQRLDFVVANKIDANDDPGKGLIYFTDVFAIMP